MTCLMQPEENFIVIDGQGNVVDIVDEQGNGASATEDFLGQLSLSALQGAVYLKEMKDGRTNWHISVLVCSLGYIGDRFRLRKR